MFLPLPFHCIFSLVHVVVPFPSFHSVMAPSFSYVIAESPFALNLLLFVYVTPFAELHKRTPLLSVHAVHAILPSLTCS